MAGWSPDLAAYMIVIKDRGGVDPRFGGLRDFRGGGGMDSRLAWKVNADVRWR